MHVIKNYSCIRVPKIVEKELGLTKLLQQQNGAIFRTQCSYLGPGRDAGVSLQASWCRNQQLTDIVRPY